MDENKKIGFFKSIFYSITNIEKYPEMAAQGMAKTFGYLMKIMIIFSVIVCIGLMYQFSLLVKNGVNYIQNDLPDMSYSNGELTVESEEPIILKNVNSVVNNIIIDTNTADEGVIDEYVKSISQEDSGIILLKNKIIIKNSAVATSNIYSYNDLLGGLSNENIESATKQDLVNYLSGSKMNYIYISFFAIMFIYTLIIYLVSVLVDILLIAILGNITTLFAKMRIKFSALFNMAVYAITLSVLLNALYIAVNTITGFEIKYFQVMYIAIAYIYITATIFIIKIDYTKRQGELIRIIEEQKKVKEELDQKQDEEEKKEEEKKEKDKDADEENKKEQEDDNNEGQLNGSGA